jgi:hypothetical protein
MKPSKFTLIACLLLSLAAIFPCALRASEDSGVMEAVVEAQSIIQSISDAAKPSSKTVLEAAKFGALFMRAQELRSRIQQDTDTHRDGWDIVLASQLIYASQNLKLKLKRSKDPALAGFITLVEQSVSALYQAVDAERIKEYEPLPAPSISVFGHIGTNPTFEELKQKEKIQKEIEESRLNSIKNRRQAMLARLAYQVTVLNIIPLPDAKDPK